MNIKLTKAQLVSQNTMGTSTYSGMVDVLAFKFDNTVHHAQMIEMNITYTLEKLYAKDNLYFPMNGAWVRVNGYGTANAEFIFPFATTSEHHDIQLLAQHLQEAIELQLVPDWA